MADSVFDNWPSTPLPDNRSSNGGKQTPKDLPYCPPVGPAGQSHEGPGLGGTNHGNAPGQGRH